MMAQFNSCTEITSYSGNTQIYIFRKKGKKKEESSYRAYPKRQKLLGVVLIVISIIGCVIMPEDCGGCLLAGLMGIARVVCD